jgi:hypothetical protein
MAAISSNGTGGGDWDLVGTWAGGVVPVDLDTVTIVAGDTVVFNVDQSGFANGIGLTVNATGILDAETAAGTYHLKCNADITNNGEIKAGSSGTAYPSVADFTIEFNGAFEIQCGNTGVVNLYDTEPTYRFIKLSGAAAAGEGAAPNPLQVDTDVTGDIWAAGDTICVDDVGKSGLPDSEEMVIAAGGIAAGAITLTANLANAKATGAYVILCKRNIHITGGAYAVYNCDDSYIRASCNCDRFSGYGDGTEFAGVFYGSAAVFRYGENHTLSGVSTGCTYGISYGQSITVSSTGLISGGSNAVRNSYACTINGILSGCSNTINISSSMILNGTADGCDNVFSSCAGCKIFGTISNSDAAVLYGSGHIISATFTNNDDDFYRVGSSSCYNTMFGGTSEFGGYNTSFRSASDYVESFDHDQSTNAFKAWCRGGIVTSQTDSPPTGYTIWYEHACEDTTGTYPCFRQFETTVQPGTAIEVSGKIRMADGEDLTGAGETGPSLQIIDKYADPLVDSGNSPLDTDMAATIDGTELGWQDVSVIWANTGDAPRTVYVRMIAYCDSGGATDIDTVWSIADYKTNINNILTAVRPLATTVSASDTATSFTLTAGEATADAYNNMILAVQDADDDHWEERTITDWTAGRVVTVDTAFSFTPAVDDVAWLKGCGYGGPVDLTSITAKLPTNYIMGSATQADQDTIIQGGTVPDNTSTADSIKLAAAASGANDIYNENLVVLISGTGAGQSRLIADYIGGTKTAIVRHSWVTTPDDTTVYRIYPYSGILLANTGICVGGSANTITLNASAPATADTYEGHTVYISGGTGEGQARLITAYSAGRVATVYPAWDVQPVAAASVYIILPIGVGNIYDSVVSILEDTGTTLPASIAALNDITVDSIHDEVIEGTVTFRQAMRLLLSVMTGKSSGGGTTTITFRDIADSKDRLSCTVDSCGNRTAVGTRDGS